MLDWKLHCNCGHVYYFLHVTYCGSAVFVEFLSASATLLLDRPATDRAGFTGGQVTVVAVVQVDTNLGKQPAS